MTIKSPLFGDGSVRYEVLAFSEGVANQPTTTGGGGGAGKAVFQDISFMKSLEKNSPLFERACATGAILDEVLFSFVNSNEKPYYTVLVKDVFVTSYQLSSGGDRPTESLSLNFAKIQVKTFDERGKMLNIFEFDLRTGK
ncbi:MAG: type VI secretion system tube protein Hcp [Armatimonadetes bacterium]|nr:type VI secretion system tube protein Hcp [Armatimonadota bacterium]